MYIIIQPVKQEEDFSWIKVCKIDTENPVYHRIMTETEIFIYFCTDMSSVEYWFKFISKIFTQDMCDKYIPSEIQDIFMIEFNYFNREVTVIENP